MLLVLPPQLGRCPVRRSSSLEEGGRETDPCERMEYYKSHTQDLCLLFQRGLSDMSFSTMLGHRERITPLHTIEPLIPLPSFPGCQPPLATFLNLSIF